jgi:hypothetical protein
MGIDGQLRDLRRCSYRSLAIRAMPARGLVSQPAHCCNVGIAVRRHKFDQLIVELPENI